MSDLIITARLRADARGFIGDLRLSRAELDRLTDSSGRAGRGLDRLSAQGSNVSGMFLNMRNAIATLGLGLLVRDIYQTGNAFEGYESTLLSVAGTHQKAAAEMDYVRAQADRLGLALKSTTDQYSQVAAAAKGTVLQGQPARDIFEAVSESMVVLNKSSADTQGALLAITQVMSKGRVAAEELDGQLAERIPGAFKIASRAMNVSTQELRKMLELGQVTAEDFLPKFAAELRKTYGEALPSATRRASSEWNRMMNVITDRSNTVYTSGFGATLAKEIREITALLKGPELEQAATSFGELLAQGTALASDGLQFLIRNGDQVLAVLAGIAAVKTASTLISIGSAAVQATAALAAFALTPVGALAIALGVATAAVIAFGDETVKINGKTASVTDYVVAAWEMTRDAVVAGYGWMVEASATAWQAAEDYANGPWASKLGGIWQQIAEIAKNNINGMIGAFVSIGEIGGLLVDDLYKNFKWLFDAIGKYYNWLLETAGKVADKIGEFFGQATNFAKESLKEIGVAAADALGRSDLGGQIKNIVDRNLPREWLGDIWKAGGKLAEPVINDLGTRAGKLYQDRIAAAKPAPASKPQPATGIENNPGGGSGAPVITAQRQTAHANAVKRIKQGYLDLLPPQERNIEAAKQWYEEAIKGLDANQKGYAEFKAEADEVYQHLIEQGSTDWQAGLKRGLREIGEEASDMASQTERALTNFNRAGETAFVGLMRGTTSLSSAFSNMADSIINDILRMMYQQQIAKPIAGFASDFLSSFIGGFSFGTTNFDSTAAHYNGGGRTGVNMSAVGSFHSGGQVRTGGENPRMLPNWIFDNAPRFHNGRIPGLQPGELAAVLKDDEEVLTRNNPRHIFNAGRSGSISGNSGMIMLEPKFEITLENQTGQEMAQPTVESRGTKNGAQQLYILLKPMISNDIANGSLGKQIGSQFNTSQSLIRR
jgi:tape measure domain-containing protein